MQILKKYLLGILISCLSLNLWVVPASAQIAIEDSFTATSNCPAVQSIRKGTNIGNIKLTPNQTYPVVGKNQDNPSHYLLKISGAEPAQRWVSKQCGRLLSAVPTDNPTPVGNNPGQGKKYVLALSWQPAFCETHPDKTECKTQTEDRFDATNLTLHGLWPASGSYCGVSGNIKKLDGDKQWDNLPPITLSPQIAQALAAKMPGFSSNLQLHEWYKHGTCYGTNPDRYFQDAMLLQDRINSSKVRELFVNNIDKVITLGDIRSSFDSSFGTNAGTKVAVECTRDLNEDRATMMTELQINLTGEITNNPSLANLIAAGKNAKKDNCPKGEVDRAGVDR
jgi:ribonuclease T2